MTISISLYIYREREKDRQSELCYSCPCPCPCPRQFVERGCRRHEYSRTFVDQLINCSIK